ncbi:MAG: RNA-binding protein [Magnetococcales bacterium]|nr:RNA-binding protein [Magnetococcales bacterium]
MQKSIILILALTMFAPSLGMAIDAGDYARVNWKGSWYDAKVLDVSGTRLLVHYTGYDSSWDEWVTMNRVAIQVLWKGKWYNASTIRAEEGQVLVHYTGYDNSWDEWVDPSRIRSYK